MTSINKTQSMSRNSWIAIFILAISTFTIVTTELAPVGLLTPMANGLSVSESEIGMTVTLYAWVGALSALLASIFLGKINKKKLLLMLTIVLFLSNILSASVDSYKVLLAARVIGALAHGAFWAIIGATAVAIVPDKYIGVATSIVFGGVSTASVFGIPLSNYIGITLGWRQAFWLMSGLSIVSFVGILTFVPQIKSNSGIGVKSLKKVLKSSTMWKIYFATLLVITAHFAAFTYIEPWLNLQSVLSTQLIPVALFIFGLAGLLGNFITGIAIDKHLKLTVITSAILICGVLIYLSLNDQKLTNTVIFIMMAVWGISVSGIFVGFQTWVLKLAGDDVFPASAIYVSCFNISIGLGAMLGAWFVSSLTIPILYITAGIVSGASVLIVMIIPTQLSKVSRSIYEKS